TAVMTITAIAALIPAASAAEPRARRAGRSAATDLDAAAPYARATADHTGSSATAHAGTAADTHLRGTAATDMHIWGTAATDMRSTTATATRAHTAGCRRVPPAMLLGEACGRRNHWQNQRHGSGGTQNFKADHYRLHLRDTA